MIIHKKDDLEAETIRLGKFISLTHRRKKWLQISAILGALMLVFLLGVFAQKKSLFRQIRNEVGFTDTNLVILKNLIREPAFTIDALLNYQLPTIYIDMGFENFQRIEAKREEALQLGLLITSDDDFVPAEIRYENRTIEVKMRLKGDLTDHFSTDKWSYRIHVKGDDQLFGMRRFSIQHPSTRKYLLEWGWLENLRNEGVLAPRYRFVNVIMNGDPKGIYALEEHFSAELLESQERRQGLIIGFDESNFWQRYAELGYSPGYYDSVYSSDYKSAIIGTSRALSVERDPVLTNERDEGVGLLRAFQEGKLPASQVFDAELMGRFLAVSELWHAYHSMYWVNMHFYYNPVTAKLEPIGFDGTPDPSSTITLYAFSDPWLIRALDDPVIATAYVREMDRLSQPDYLEQLRIRFDESYKNLQLALYREFPFILSINLWDVIDERQDYIRRSLEPSNMVLAFTPKSGDDRISDSIESINVNVRNVLTLPVEILGFQIGDRFTPADASWDGSFGEVYTSKEGESSILLAGVGNEDGDSIEYAEFQIPDDLNLVAANIVESTEISVITRIIGKTSTVSTPVHIYPEAPKASPLPSMPSVGEVLELHPFLVQDDDQDFLAVNKGDWQVRGDLVLPDGMGLRINPGTALHFEPDAILLASSPLEFRGTSQEPIVLSPVNETWGGVVVLQANEPSIWDYVEVRNADGINRGGWTLTGGLTFYKSPIALYRTRFLGSMAEDGLNLIHSEYVFHECEFGYMASDAFDGDFSDGEIRACSFHDVHGDAIDVSGSNVHVTDVYLKNVGDKGISAGEGSLVYGKNLKAADIGIAVASKDLSHVELLDVDIERAVRIGLAAYEKKAEYGPASITAKGITFDSVPEETLVQTRSWIDLNNEFVDGTDIDVKALYEAGILGNQ